MNRNRKFYYVVLRYGHVGVKREVSVARYLDVDREMTALDVFRLASNMPGTKANAVHFLKEISHLEYMKGKQLEGQNFYIQKLKEA